MNKDPKPVNCHDEKFRGYLSPSWTLCVGAGISRGIAPDWFDLTYQVVAETLSSGISEDGFQELTQDSGWTLDSWIQAAANHHVTKKGSLVGFNDLIESVLYSRIRQKSKGLGLEKYLVRVLNRPNLESRERVFEVCDFIDTEFSNTSLLQVAELLLRAAKEERAPKAVLTFNADTFLETYLQLRLRRDHYLGPGPYGAPISPFVAVTRPNRSTVNKIPIIHCHGSVAPRPRKMDVRDSRDRLVFLEQEYLSIVSSGAAWAESIFLYHAQSSKMAFVGMSMSDTNIRRWMSFANMESEKDQEVFGYSARPNPDHIWVRPPPSPEAEYLLLVSLRHLGIRPAWLQSWSKLRDGLENLCAIPTV